MQSPQQRLSLVYKGNLNTLTDIRSNSSGVGQAIHLRLWLATLISGQTVYGMRGGMTLYIVDYQKRSLPLCM